GPLVRGDDGRHARGNGRGRGVVRRRPGLRRRRVRAQGPSFRNGRQCARGTHAGADGRQDMSTRESTCIKANRSLSPKQFYRLGERVEVRGPRAAEASKHLVACKPRPLTLPSPPNKDHSGGEG